VIGNFIGSFVGGLVGSAIGSIFDPNVVPWDAQIVSAAAGGVLALNYANANSTGHAWEFTNLSVMVSSQANQVLALTRGNPNVGDISGLSGNGALAAARGFPRRQLITGAEGGAHYLRTHRARRLNTRLIHSREKQSACG
jgi:hypothetical protein